MTKDISKFHEYTDDEMASIRRGESMKDIDFQGYNEGTWEPIQNAIARIGGDANKCTLPCFHQHTSWIEVVTLRDELENLGRRCLLFAEAQKRATTNSDQKKRFIAKAQQAESFRLRLMEEYALIPDSRRIEALFSELAQILTFQIEVASSKPSSSKYNASLPHLDYYFHGLNDVWRAIGGPNSGKQLNAFIQACAEPVIGPSSSSFKAIDKRIQRLDASGVLRIRRYI